MMCSFLLSCSRCLRLRAAAAMSCRVRSSKCVCSLGAAAVRSSRRRRARRPATRRQQQCMCAACYGRGVCCGARGRSRRFSTRRTRLPPLPFFPRRLPHPLSARSPSLRLCLRPALDGGALCSTVRLPTSTFWIHICIFLEWCSWDAFSAELPGAAEFYYLWRHD